MGFPGKTKKHEVYIEHSTCDLRVQLGTAFTVDWLQEIYGMATAPVEKFFSFGSMIDDDGVGGAPAEKVSVMQAWYPGHPAFELTDNKIPDIIPPAPSVKTFIDALIPSTTVKEISDVLLREEWPYYELLGDVMKCRDI